MVCSFAASRRRYVRNRARPLDRRRDGPLARRRWRPASHICAMQRCVCLHTLQSYGRCWRHTYATLHFGRQDTRIRGNRSKQLTRNQVRSVGQKCRFWVNSSKSSLRPLRIGHCLGSRCPRMCVRVCVCVDNKTGAAAGRHTRRQQEGISQRREISHTDRVCPLFG